MNNEDLADIAEARELFAKWERSQDPAERRRYVEYAIDLLNSAIEGTSELSLRATTIKETYIRKMLEQAPSLAAEIVQGLASRQSADWFRQHFTDAQIVEMTSLLYVFRD